MSAPANRANHVPSETLAAALRDELVYLWNDLADAYGNSRATPPETSIGCEGLIHRIHAITSLVGRTPPEQVPIPFLLTGVYERVHAQIGITATIPANTLQRVRDYLREQQQKGRMAV